MNKPITLNMETIVSIEKPCREVYVDGKKVVTIENGWNIAEVTIGSDNDRTKRRLIITADKED